MDYLKFTLELIEKVPKRSPVTLGIIAGICWIAVLLKPIREVLENNSVSAKTFDWLQLTTIVATVIFAVSVIARTLDAIHSRIRRTAAIAAISKLRRKDAAFMALCLILEIRIMPKLIGTTLLNRDDMLGLESKGILITSSDSTGGMICRFPDYIIDYLGESKLAVLQALFDANSNLGNRLARFLKDPDIAKMVLEHLQLLFQEELITNPPVELIQLASTSHIQLVIDDVPSDIADE